MQLLDARSRSPGFLSLSKPGVRRLADGSDSIVGEATQAQFLDTGLALADGARVSRHSPLAASDRGASLIRRVHHAVAGGDQRCIVVVMTATMLCRSEP